MLKAEWLQVKGQGPGTERILDAPLLGQIEKFPFAAAFFAAVIMAVLLFPALVCPGRIPYDLGVRTDEKVRAPTLQLFSLGGVQYLIIFPAVCYPYNSTSYFLKYFWSIVK